MEFETVISCEEAARHLGDPRWVFVDCRFALGDKAQGYREYLDAHVAGAVFADLDRDLSGRIIPGQTGRHPLPEKDDLAKTIAALGISNDSQVVAYDGQAGQMAAARLWWLLKWAGHRAVAVLDGGFPLWSRLGLAVQGGSHQNRGGTFTPAFEDRLIVSAEGVLETMADPDSVLVDVRTADRYRGENEIIDPVAGHIPGAVSAPYVDNIASDGTLKGKEELAQQFEGAVGRVTGESAIFYCGSGVTAAQGILAFAHCGKGMARLYAGSWSEWITDSERMARKFAVLADEGEDE